MRILIAVASKHGSTHEIADVIAGELVERGLEVAVLPVRDVRSIEGYDAVVLGSAIYLGQWLKTAKEFAAHQGPALASVPVWLFSSGPVGEAASKPEDQTDRRQGDEIAAKVGARDHRVFPGRLDRKDLSVMERAAVRMAKAEDGDYRDRAAITAWAAGIADALLVPAGAG